MTAKRTRQGRSGGPNLTKSGVMRITHSAKEPNIKGNRLEGGDRETLTAIDEAPSPWLAIVEPRSEREAGIFVLQHEDGHYEARFDMRLAIVSSESISRKSTAPSDRPAQPVHSDFANAISALIRTMAVGQSLIITHSMDDTTARGRQYDLHIRALSTGNSIEKAVESARRFQANLTSVLAVGLQEFGFHMLTAPDLRCPRSCKHRIVLVPTALEIMTHRKQVATFVTNTVPRAAVRLPLPATSTRRYLATVIPAPTALPFQTIYRRCG